MKYYHFFTVNYHYFECHYFYWNWTLNISRNASYEIILVRLSLCPSVAKFSQDWIISFLWYCLWWQLTMISSNWSHIFEKLFKILPNLGPAVLNLAQDEVFSCCYLDFGSQVLLEIRYDDSVRQFLTSRKK